MMTAKKLCSPQYSCEEWCITSFLLTQYTLLKSKPSPTEAICGYMKVAISASTEAFLCQKKTRKNNINKLSTY